MNADEAAQHRDGHAGDGGQILGQDSGGGLLVSLGLVAEDFGSESLRSQGEDADGHEHEGEAHGKHTDRCHPEDDAVGADSCQHDARRRWAGHHAAGDPQEHNLLGGDAATGWGGGR